jgi:putative DNA primase/helicase
LLAIADDAGFGWPERALRAAVELSRGDLEDDAIGVQLLADIRDIFASEGLTRIPSTELVVALLTLDERPWSSYKGKGISAVEVARLLRQFEVKSKQLRIYRANLRGYEIGDFVDPFARYLEPAAVPVVAATTLRETENDEDLAVLDGAANSTSTVAP